MSPSQIDLTYSPFDCEGETVHISTGFENHVRAQLTKVFSVFGLRARKGRGLWSYVALTEGRASEVHTKGETWDMTPAEKRGWLRQKTREAIENYRRKHPANATGQMET